MLYLIATPIGNIQDISLRALETLKICDIVLCEDTRHSGLLLQKLGIKKKLLSYHKFNEKKSLAHLLEELKEGKNIALISDAGIPCINDPGLILVQACIAENVPFTALPGACSPILALILSGMDTSCFQYLGFIPKNEKKTLCKALHYPGTTIILESPMRIGKTLESIHQIDPTRKVAVVREMTKVHEECIRGPVMDVIAKIKQKPIKGEMILLIEEGDIQEGLSLEETIEMLQQFHGLSLKEAIKLAAKLQKVSKRALYQNFHQS